MSLDTTEKQQLINTHQTHGTDTGSAEVQVAMLSERINRLSSHLQNIHAAHGSEQEHAAATRARPVRVDVRAHTNSRRLLRAHRSRRARPS